MRQSDISFTNTKIVITYDLSNNDISAKEIADASYGVFTTTITIQNAGLFLLPNTTLLSSQNISAREAVAKFKQAFNLAKSRKYFSSCTISRLFCNEVYQKDGYIENN